MRCSTSISDGILILEIAILSEVRKGEAFESSVQWPSKPNCRQIRFEEFRARLVRAAGARGAVDDGDRSDFYTCADDDGGVDDAGDDSAEDEDDDYFAQSWRRGGW